MGTLIAGTIKGTVCVVGDENEPMPVGEVYLYDSTVTIIDSTCIGEIADFEYRFEDYGNGKYFVKLKAVKNDSDRALWPWEWYFESTNYRVILSGGGDGGADIIADEMGSDITSCD
jgi:hypothetical protein